MLYGEGIDSSIIYQYSGPGYVAQTEDNFQQTGNDIGGGGATLPNNITIANMAFSTYSDTNSIFLVNTTTNCKFDNVGFYGVETVSTIPTSTSTAVAVDFYQKSGEAAVYNIVFDGCAVKGIKYAVNTDVVTEAVIFTNSKFSTLYQGFVLNGPTGTRITNNQFNAIYAEGIVFNSELNASGYNIFYNVGNEYDDEPVYNCISFLNTVNVSIGDMFSRLSSNGYVPQVSGSELALGNSTTVYGKKITLPNNTTNIAFRLDTTVAKSFKIDYSIIRDTAYRNGTLWVNNGTTVNYSDDYNENEDSGITLSAALGTSPLINVNYKATNTGLGATMRYTVSYFN